MTNHNSKGGPSALARFSLSCVGTPHGQRWPKAKNDSITMSLDSSSSGNTWYQTYFDGPNTLTHQEPHHTPYHPKRGRPFTARGSCSLTPLERFHAGGIYSLPVFFADRGAAGAACGCSWRICPLLTAQMRQKGGVLGTRGVLE